MDSDREIEIIVGTYEDYVVGYQVETIGIKTAAKNPAKRHKASDNKSNLQSNGVSKHSPQVAVEQSFAVRGHSGSVRCLTCTPDGSLMFSAGQDEMMNLFNLKKRKLLQTSEGSVTCANFVANTHLICGADDGNVYIHECKSSGMKLVKTLRGHKAGVSAIDTHRSGKVLLSLSKDKTMRTWNLIKGRIAYVTNLGIDAHIVKWIRGSDGFLVAANKEIYLYNSGGHLDRKVAMEKRINSIEFIANKLFVVAIDSGNLEFFSIEETDCKSLMKFEAHESRIKSVECLTKPDDLTDDEEKVGGESHLQIVTASSDGLVKLWSISRRRSTLDKPQELASVDVGARLTCMIASRRNIST